MAASVLLAHVVTLCSQKPVAEGGDFRNGFLFSEAHCRSAQQSQQRCLAHTMS